MPGALLLNLPEVKLAEGLTPIAWLGTLILGAIPLAKALVRAELPPLALSLPAKLFCRAESIGNAAVERSAGELHERA